VGVFKRRHLVVSLVWFVGLAATVAGQNGTAHLMSGVVTQAATENALASVRRSDVSARDATGKISRLSSAEHMRRASVYMSNRAFEEARAHWQALIDYYPQDPRVPEAMLGIGRSYFQSRYYSEAYTFFDRLARNYGSTKEGVRV